MLKKIIVILLISCSNLIIADNKNASDKSSAEENKKSPVVIKIIKGRKVAAETLEGKDIESKLGESRNEFDKEIKSLDEKIQKKVNDFQAKVNSRLYDADFLEKMQAEILREKKERDVKAESAQEQFSRQFNNALARFNGEIKTTVTEVAQKEGWDIVKIEETGEIIYASSKVDVSDKIVSAHDASYKAKRVKKSKIEAENKNSDNKEVKVS